MNYINTNISLPEDDYARLKAEAIRRKKNLKAVIKEKLIPQRRKIYSKAEVEKIMAETKRLAEKNSKILKGWDSLKALREIRNEN